MCDFFRASFTEMFSTINDFIGSQASQNKAILSVLRRVRFMIGLITLTSGNYNLSKMTIAHRTTRNARAAPLPDLSRLYVRRLDRLSFGNNTDSWDNWYGSMGSNLED